MMEEWLEWGLDQSQPLIVVEMESRQMSHVREAIAQTEQELWGSVRGA